MYFDTRVYFNIFYTRVLYSLHVFRIKLYKRKRINGIWS